MNIQASVDYLTEMLESAKYEAIHNPQHIAVEFGEVRNSIEEILATLEYIQKLKLQE